MKLIVIKNRKEPHDIVSASLIPANKEKDTINKAATLNKRCDRTIDYDIVEVTDPLVAYLAQERYYDLTKIPELVGRMIAAFHVISEDIEKLSAFVAESAQASRSSVPASGEGESV